METSEIFDTLLENLKVGEQADTIASRRDEITKALNKDFRSKDGCTEYTLAQSAPKTGDLDAEARFRSSGSPGERRRKLHSDQAKK